MASTVFATVSTPGPPGPAGPAGPPGYGGTWIVQSGPPSNLIGNNGDMYLNNSAGAGGGDVYGPKASGIWPASTTNIKGAPGTPGAPGYSPTYIVQASPPTAGQGNNGDMYINSATSDLYGPKTSGAWGPIVANLRGQTGAQGPPGVGYNPRGAWSAGTIYAQGDQVSYNSQLWISLQAGNINNTPSTSPTFWQAVGSGASQTPWLSAIDGGGFNLGNVGQIAVGNPGATPPFTGAGFVHLIVGPTVASSQCGIITAASNTATTNGVVGELTFSNYNLATSDKRVSTIDVLVDGANANYSAMLFRTTATGSGGLLERMRITSAGYVGIANSGVLPDANTGNPALIVGATGPSSTAGEITACGNASSGLMGSFQFANYANAAADKRIALIASTTDGAPNSGNILFYTYNVGSIVERMRITTGGNVGIGTGVPPFRFSVHVATDQNLAIASASGRAAFESYNDALSLSMPMGFDASRFDFIGGNVGIGMVPTVTLDITGNEVHLTAASGTNYVRYEVMNAANTLQLAVEANSGGVVTVGSTGNAAIISSQNAYPMHFCTANQIRMTISSTGLVGIGLTGPAVPVDIVCPPGSVYGLRIRQSNVPTSDYFSFIVDNASNGSFRIEGYDNGTAVIGLAQQRDGRVGVRNSSPAWPLDVAGDVNCTGVYRINGTPISTGGGGITTQVNAGGSRSLGVNYTNNGGKPVFVTASIQTPSGQTVNAYCDSSATPAQIVASSGNGSASFTLNIAVSFWVIPGYSFRVTCTSGGSVYTWTEWN